MDRIEFDKWLDFLDKGGTTEEWNKLKKKRITPQIKLKDAGLKTYSEDEVNEVARQTDKYIKKKSKWSGNINVDDNAKAYGNAIL